MLSWKPNNSQKTANIFKNNISRASCLLYLVAKGLLEQNIKWVGGRDGRPNDHNTSLEILCYNKKQLSRPKGYVKAKRRLLPEINKIKIVVVNNVVHNTKMTTVNSLPTDLVV